MTDEEGKITQAETDRCLTSFSRDLGSNSTLAISLAMSSGPGFYASYFSPLESATPPLLWKRQRGVWANSGAGSLHRLRGLI